MENNESPPTNYDQMTHDEEGDPQIISVHSSDTSCAPSDSPIFLNESILNNDNGTPIDSTRVRVQTRPGTENNILNSGVRTRSMVARSPTGLFTPANVRNTVSNILDSVRRGLNRLDTFYNPSASQEGENTAIIAKCSYYGPTKKTFDWLTEFEDKGNFGFGLVTAVQSDMERCNSKRIEQYEQKERMESGSDGRYTQ